jgi:hypothetical protein
MKYTDKDTSLFSSSLLAFTTHLRVLASSFLRFRYHEQWHFTVGRTPLDEWSARRRDLYLTTHNTHNRQTSMPPAGFETAIPAGERLQTHALDRSATGIGTDKDAAGRNSSVPGCDSALLGESVLKFQSIVVLSSSYNSLDRITPKKALRTFEMSGISDPLSQHHIPQNLDSLRPKGEKHKSRNMPLLCLNYDK